MIPEIIGYLGIAWCVLLLLIINKQIIGGGVYTTRGPIILAGLRYSGIFSWLSFFILLGASYLARELTRIIIKQIYASQILKNILYVWLTLLLYFAAHYAGYSQPSVYLDLITILSTIGAIIILSSVLSRVYTYGKGDFSRGGVLYFSRFFVLGGLIYFIVTSSLLLDFFSGRLWLLGLITILMIMAGTYDGLQLKEMIRFRKLLWASRTTRKYHTSNHTSKS